MTSAVAMLFLGAAIIALLIAANGYFVAQEFAFMSVDRSRLRARAAEGDPAAARSLRVTDRTSFMLSGAQLGITVTGLLVGYAAEPLVGEAIGEMLGGAGAPAVLSVSVVTAVVLVLATVVQMIFGELFPKNLAIANPEPLALRLSRSTLIYLRVLGWLITIFDHAAEALLRLLRMEPVSDVDSTATADDLEHIVADSRRSGDLPEELSFLIDRVLDFPDRDAAHAMIPRSRVGHVTEGTTVAELRALMAQAHTRYPVLSADGDPVGVVQLTDLLRQRPAADAAATSVMREPLLLPETMSLPDALARMTRSHHELACVIDEFGGFSGILTVEDLAEELIGEMHDEHDADHEEVTVSEEDFCWEMAGDLHVDEVERVLGHRLPEGDDETLAGLVISELGELPEVGHEQVIELPQAPSDLVSDAEIERALRVEVLEVERHVPSRLRVRLDVTEDKEPSAGDGAEDEQEEPS